MVSMKQLRTLYVLDLMDIVLMTLRSKTFCTLLSKVDWCAQGFFFFVTFTVLNRCGVPFTSNYKNIRRTIETVYQNLEFSLLHLAALRLVLLTHGLSPEFFDVVLRARSVVCTGHQTLGTGGASHGHCLVSVRINRLEIQALRHCT